MIVALLEHEGSLPTSSHWLGVHRPAEIPLIACPPYCPAHFDVGVHAVEAHLLHARALQLVQGQKVGPTEDGRRPECADEDSIIGIGLAQTVNVAELPGPQHLDRKSV